MLSELEWLYKGATPGEWAVDDSRYVSDPDGRAVVLAPVTQGIAAPQALTPVNLLFIAAARNALPALLRVARASIRMHRASEAAHVAPIGSEDYDAAVDATNAAYEEWCAALAALTTTTTAPPASE